MMLWLSMMIRMKVFKQNMKDIIFHSKISLTEGQISSEILCNVVGLNTAHNHSCSKVQPEFTLWPFDMTMHALVVCDVCRVKVS